LWAVKIQDVDTFDAIWARRNVRQFADRAIPAEDLDRILEAGRRSPSASNRQRWDFVLCTERSQLEELANVWRGGWHIAGAAAAIALLAPRTEDDHERNSIQYDLGQVTMNLMTAAAALGIGSCHSSVADQDLARRLLGHPEDRLCAYVIGFGYPADRPLRPMKRPNRRPFDEVVHRGRW
jgi:nitroreductase